MVFHQPLPGAHPLDAHRERHRGQAPDGLLKIGLADVHANGSAPQLLGRSAGRRRPGEWVENRGGDGRRVVVASRTPAEGLSRFFCMESLRHDSSCRDAGMMRLGIALYIIGSMVMG